MNMVQGLVGSSVQPVEGRTGLGARLARNSASGRGIMSRLSADIEVYCVLKCEGQERRTLKVPVSDKYGFPIQFTMKNGHNCVHHSVSYCYILHLVKNWLIF